MADKRKKRFLKVIKWIGISFALLFGVAIALPFVFEDEVKQVALEQINKHVKASIKVEEIDLSFIKRFPHTSLQFKNVSIDQAEGFGDSLQLMRAKNILIKFSLIDIIKKNYAFERIEFVDFFFNPIVDSNGEVNYEIFKSEEEQQDSTNIFLDLKHIEISNSRIVYINQLTKQNLDLEIQKCQANANFGKEAFLFGLNTELHFNEFSEDGVRLAQNKHLTADLKADYNLKTQKLHLASSELQYEALQLKLDGHVTPLEDASALDLNIRLAQANLKDILNELPKEQRAQFDAYKLNGQLITNAHISGIVDKNNLPKIDVEFKLSEGSLSIPDQNLTISKVRLDGSYSNGKRMTVSTTEVLLNTFSFQTTAGFFNGNLQLYNLKSPTIRLNASSDIELSAFTSLFPIEALEALNGQMKLDIHSKISLKNWQNSELRTFDIEQLSGDASLQNVNVNLAGDKRSYENINGHLKFGKDKIKIEELQVDVNKQHLELSGRVHHLAALLNPLSSEKLMLQCNLTSPELDFDELLDDGLESDETEYTSNLPSDYDVFIDFHVGRFLWNPYVATNVSGKLSLLDGDLEIKPLRFNAIEGSFDGQLAYLCSDKEINFLQTKGKIKQMNVSQIFSTFNNFDQEVLQSDNIKGKISADIDLHIYETKEGKWLEESLSCNAHIIIDDGELIDVQELNALKKYTRIDDFSHIQFSRLENDILISKSQILIPEMAIHSDKMNIDVFGKHTFDNTYEYHFKNQTK